MQQRQAVAPRALVNGGDDRLLPDLANFQLATLRQLVSGGSADAVTLAELGQRVSQPNTAGGTLWFVHINLICRAPLVARTSNMRSTTEITKAFSCQLSSRFCQLFFIQLTFQFLA